MTCTDSTITIKKGATFAALCTYKVDGVPVSVATFTITSQIRTSAGDIVATLTAVKIPANTGEFRFDQATSTWPIGSAFWDIKYDDAGSVFLTETMNVNIVGSITA